MVLFEVCQVILVLVTTFGDYSDLLLSSDDLFAFMIQSFTLDISCIASFCLNRERRGL